MEKTFKTVYMKCKHCGMEKSVRFNVEQIKYKTDKNDEKVCILTCPSCGKEEEYKLKNLRFACECGSNFRGATTLEEKAEDVKCHRCGSLVAVEWKENKQAYINMDW